MPNDRREQIRDLYGFAFPDDLFEFWSWFESLDQDLREAFNDVLGMRPAGVMDVLAGKFDDVSLVYPATLHWRYLFDPPEFFTLFTGDTDGLHWGYWFDDPEKGRPFVCSWYARDAFDLSVDGITIFDAIESRIEECNEGIMDNIEFDPDHEANYRANLLALEKLHDALPETSARSSKRRVINEDLNGGIGISVPKNAPPDAVELLICGKEAWEEDRMKAFPLLEEAYRALGRNVLANVTRIHHENPSLPNLDVFYYKAGDFNDLEEALAQPELVKKLELGRQNLTELPGLDGNGKSRGADLVWKRHYRFTAIACPM